VLSIVIIPFLLVAFVVLYFWPSADDTARLFAWRIVPGFTSMALASAYLGGAYFFLRAARAKQWHTVGGGFIPVALFASLMGIATITHWDKFIHTNVAFWLWATLYFTTPYSSSRYGTSIGASGRSPQRGTYYSRRAPRCYSARSESPRL